MVSHSGEDDEGLHGRMAGLVRVHRNVIPDMREKVKVARAILESYADVPDFDPREQRWTLVETSLSATSPASAPKQRR